MAVKFSHILKFKNLPLPHATSCTVLHNLRSAIRGRTLLQHTQKTESAKANKTNVLLTAVIAARFPIGSSSNVIFSTHLFSFDIDIHSHLY